MSFVTIGALESTTEMLSLNIEDISKELVSLERNMKELDVALTKCLQRSELLNHRLLEKKNMLHTMTQLINYRQKQLDNDRSIQEKVSYALQCNAYLKEHSSVDHHYEGMLMDETIEYAQKLHFLRLMQLWISSRCERTPISFEIPKDETCFHEFEMTHMKDEFSIILSSKPSTSSRCYSPSILVEETHTLNKDVELVVPIDKWYEMYVYRDGLTGFSIHCLVDYIDHLVHTNPNIGFTT
jgi:hypothetical protein